MGPNLGLEQLCSIHWILSGWLEPFLQRSLTPKENEQRTVIIQARVRAGNRILEIESGLC